MQRLSSKDMVLIRDRAQGLSAADRAMAILEYAYPEASRGELELLCIGERDRRLFAIYEQTFGRGLDGSSECPGCGEHVEFNFDAKNVTGTGSISLQAHEFELVRDGLVLRYRLPNTADLLAAMSSGCVSGMRSALVRLCVLDAGLQGKPLAPGELSPEAIERLASHMAEQDPAADILLDIACPSCGCRWQVTLDIVSFIWAGISMEARRLLYDVHALASAYGWSEADILGMSMARRQFYLELIG